MDREERLVNERYKNAVNFYYLGIVVEVNIDFNVHSCLLRIELDTTTISSFDIRDTTPYYHEVIKGSVAEVMEHVIYDHMEGRRNNYIAPGMRYTFDGNVDSAYLFSEGELVESWPIRISTFELLDISRFHRIPMDLGKEALERNTGWPRWQQGLTFFLF